MLPHRIARAGAACDLVALDLDGTTLDAGGNLTERTAAAIRAASARRPAVAVISARPLTECRRLAREHRLQVWIGASNGAVGGTTDDPRPLWSTAFAQAEVVRVVEALRATSRELALGAVADDVLVLDEHFPRELARRWGDPPAGAITDAADRNVHKIIAAHGLDAGRAEVDTRAALADLSSVVVTRSSDEFVEISPSVVSKGDALCRIAACLGVRLDRCAAVGDMPNDLSMLAAAGLPLAVANAHPDVLAAAVHVLPSNLEDGVAVFLEAAVGDSEPLRATARCPTTRGQR